MEPCHPKIRRGFTLIELLVVISLVSMLLVVLYGGFQTGLKAYTRSEENLAENHEGDVFLMQLERELHSAIPYYQKGETLHFVGDEQSISFPVFGSQYSDKGVEKGLYYVVYEFKGRSLVR